MTQIAWDTERVRQLLLRARELTSVSQGRILGARLGKSLRNFDREFFPGVLGDKKLVALLGRYPDLGTIERAEQDFVFQFYRDGVPADRVHTSEVEPPLEAPSVAAADAGEEEQAALPGIESANTRIDHTLWLALVAEHAPEVYVDLQALSLVTELAASAQIQSEPERFARVPSIPQESLRQVARDFAQSHVDSNVRDTLGSVLEGGSWFRDFTDRAERFGISDKWLSAHRTFVIGWARAWFIAHGLKPDRFIRGRSRPTQAIAPAVVSPSGKSLGGIRRIVHSAIDRMSDDELLNLSMPLRYLFPK
jgi:hypothetical protein